MKLQTKRTWVEIDLDALKHNMQVIRKFTAPGAKIMGVVKADAYGHGVVPVAKTVLQNGADWLAVSMLDEAIEIRNAGITAPVLILSDNEPECAETIVKNDIRQGVYSIEAAEKLSAAAVKLGKKAKIHLKVDTGMGRVGFMPQETPDIAERIAQLPSLEIEGIFTHFAVADEYSDESNAYTKMQYEKFCEVCERIEIEKHINIPVKHVANSAAILRFPKMHLDLVRAGIILYGLWPSEETKNENADLKAVMTMKSVVSYVKEIEKGSCVSYGCTYCADKKTMVATIPVGYADGYMRVVSNKGFVYHERSGQKLPVIGRICMDQMMVDASLTKNFGGILPGDKVVLFGDYDEDKNRFPTAEGIAKLAGTINYEISCAVTRRVPKIIIENGEITEIINRLTTR